MSRREKKNIRKEYFKRLRATLKEKLNTKHVFQVTNPYVNAKMA